MRFDLALSDLRLFKSRSQASLAIQDGAALLNGELVKPGRGVRPGDRVTLVGPGGRRTYQVLGLPRRSLSRAAARELLREVMEPNPGRWPFPTRGRRAG
jgi:ribosome-associated heat shock protein Hsp15